MSESRDVANPFAAPAAAVVGGPEPSEEAIAPATRLSRLLATLVDFFICNVGMLGAIVVFAVRRSSSSPEPEGFGTNVGMVVLLWYAVAALVQLQFLRRSDGTIGKRLLGLRIQRPDGSRPGFARLVYLRAVPFLLVGAIPMFGPLILLVEVLPIFAPPRRCLHDLLAGTVVVKAPRSTK